MNKWRKYQWQSHQKLYFFSLQGRSLGRVCFTKSDFLRAAAPDAVKTLFVAVISSAADCIIIIIAVLFLPLCDRICKRKCSQLEIYMIGRLSTKPQAENGVGDLNQYLRDWKHYYLLSYIFFFHGPICCLFFPSFFLSSHFGRLWKRDAVRGTTGKSDTWKAAECHPIAHESPDDSSCRLPDKKVREEM